MSSRKFKSTIPDFQTLFLQSVADAFGKRSKAIRHRVGEFSMERDLDTRGEVPLERLHAEFRCSGKWSTAFYLTIWEHAKAWICVRELKKAVGATFLVKFGTDLWHVSPDEIVRRSEATFGCLNSLRQENAEGNVRAIWEPVKKIEEPRD